MWKKCDISACFIAVRSISWSVSRDSAHFLSGDQAVLDALVLNPLYGVKSDLSSFDDDCDIHEFSLEVLKSV